MTRIVNAALVAFLALPAWADQVTIEPVKDNTLIENEDGLASNALGPIFAGQIGPNGGFANLRACVAFDVAAAVPAGATITEVRLTLMMNMAPQASPFTIELHRLQADWGEGSSGSTGGRGSPSTPGDATWIHRFFNDTFWSTRGGDFAAAASASLPVGGLGPYTWVSTPVMVSDVQQWLDSPTENFGWCLIGDESTSFSVKRFSSREDGTPSNRPMLEITFKEGGCDPCDMNCSGAVNALDIEPFLDLLFDPKAVPCAACTGDVNGDEKINALDIEPFLNCLFP